jgi:hypothetical protein
MPDYNLGHDEKTIIFMFHCEPMAHVDSRLSGIFPKEGLRTSRNDSI